MSSINSRLSQLESKLQSWIEVNSSRLFSRRRTVEDLGQRLAASMDQGIRTLPDGRQVAPNLFTIWIHPSAASLIDDDPARLDRLAQNIQLVGDERGLKFVCPPVVRLNKDPGEMPNQIRITAQISIDNLAETSDYEVEAQPLVLSNFDQAFLIVDGTQVFPLAHSLVNIGRRQDNHLVIQDNRVSRVHAQLRWINHHYVIFDIDSTGGTFINDQRIQQCILFPGDVISLAGVPLVFGQEQIPLGETEKLDLSD